MLYGLMALQLLCCLLFYLTIRDKRANAIAADQLARLEENIKNELDFLKGNIRDLVKDVKEDTNLLLTAVSKSTLERIKDIQDNIQKNEERLMESVSKTRSDTMVGMNEYNSSIQTRISEMSSLQFKHLETFANNIEKLTDTTKTSIDKIKESVENRLILMQEDNSRKIEKMRETVDEKLHSTLEKRLGESFKLVSERLELVHNGLGEMRTLALGVGDLKRVLTNVKARGTWGEIQLEGILEQLLAPGMFEKNVATKPGSNDRVEFAIRLPGNLNGISDTVWLPIDSKFPMEDYQRLLEAHEISDVKGMADALKQLEARIKGEAKDIKTKYLAAPYTTDFGIMFLPTEGLYAETLRIPGLFETLQRDFKVIVAGPWTLAAILNSLQMGFRTLAIEKRSGEVWELLGNVKNEFSTFGDLLDKTHKKLSEASNAIESASKKTRKIEKRLKDVQVTVMPVLHSDNEVELIAADEDVGDQII